MKALLIFLCAFILFSCGYRDQPSYAPEPPPAKADPAWAALKPIVAKNCGTCHGVTQLPKFDSGAAFKASKAKGEISSGAMPPNGKLSDSDKKAMLAYLG